MRGGGGHRQRRLGDDWLRELARQDRPRPVDPASHVEVVWRGHVWGCAWGAGDARPDERSANPRGRE